MSWRGHKKSLSMDDGEPTPKMPVIPSPPGGGRGDPGSIWAKLKINFKKEIKKNNYENFKKIYSIVLGPQARLPAG
jgi:hypothetical protein